ncbi:hypothetical protein DQ04_05151020 [Trypanosoma grayi]|uniref:hypothetical protein n=1 Tax=Trypanosoma grayi TaxID=71804 RepID=UPI0004F413D8|nr:hypothetical protein DQ04_05151020 [Trypanosoma grayi]KEG09477.1 hypothetical protein DQ04_05151020 [Trypanosoma grayi]
MPLTLTKDDNGTTVRVALGDAIRINLQSTPSTGYQWTCESCQKMGEHNKAYAITSEFKHHQAVMPGAAGVQLITVTPKVAGEHELIFDYVRGWERNAAPVKRFAVKMVVA